MVQVTLALMVAAWLAVAFRLAMWFRRKAPGAVDRTAAMDSSGLIASVLAVSAVLFYNFGVTAAFADPDYRYHHFMMPIRILIAGYGLIVLLWLLGAVGRATGLHGETPPVRLLRQGAAAVRRNDAVAWLFDRHPLAADALTIGIPLLLFVWWARFMVVHTWAVRGLPS
jgi:hypothetical protein